jgi:hypothetical protein
MEKNQKIAVMAIFALVISVASISVAFAALSRSLKIEGSATFDPVPLEVKLAAPVLVDSAAGTTVVVPTLTDNDSKLSGFDVTLTKPGDYVTLKFDIVNYGGLDAVLRDFTAPIPTCTGLHLTPAQASADASLVCGGLTFTLTWNTVAGPAISNLDELDSGVTKTAFLHIEYPLSQVAVPEEDVTINILPITFKYEQK